MNIQYVRASSINTYSGCQFQYFLEYVLGLPSKSGKKALLGTITHHVLELLARAKKVGHVSDSYVDPENLLDICWERYSKEEADNYDLKKADYNFCKRTIARVIGTDYDPKNLNVLATEKSFRLPIEGFNFSYYDVVKKSNESGHYEIRGTSDLVTIINDDTIEIIDWKTGSRKDWNTGVLKDYEYLSSKDMQLRMYDLAMSMVYPQYKTRLLTIHFINDGGPFTVSFDDEQRKETVNWLKTKINDISDNWMPTRLKETDPKTSRWKCKNVCFFGKTKDKNGSCYCESIHSYMTHNGIDKTMIQVDGLKKNNDSQVKTSNRRNVHI
jgi:hypothetical protein